MRAIRLVLEQQYAHETQWGVIRSIVDKIGRSPETLRPSERDAGQRPRLTTDERERPKSLEREVQELRQANEILRKASAFFAAAELDRLRK